MAIDEYLVDLTDVGRLRQAFDAYLVHGVCPVVGPAPAVMAEVVVRIRLPGGGEIRRSGTVIQAMGPIFLVHVLQPFNVDDLRRRAGMSALAPGTTTGTMPPVSTPAAMRPPSGTPSGSHRAVSPDDLQSPRPPPSGTPSGSHRAVSPDDLLGAEAPRAPMPSPGPSRVPPRPAAEALPPPPKAPRPVPRPPEVPGEPPLNLPLGVEDLPEVKVVPIPDPYAEDFEEVAPLPEELEVIASVSPPGRGAGGPAGADAEAETTWARIRDLSVPEKQKLARHGKRIARHFLIRDPNKTLHVHVIQNPELGLDEVGEYAALPGLSREAIELIAQNTTWMASRQVVFSLARNPATPIDLAVGLLKRLSYADLKVIARPGGARAALSAVARRLMIEAGK